VLMIAMLMSSCLLPPASPAYPAIVILEAAVAEPTTQTSASGQAIFPRRSPAGQRRSPFVAERPQDVNQASARPIVFCSTAPSPHLVLADVGWTIPGASPLGENGQMSLITCAE